jgi:hypothetical protein
MFFRALIQVSSSLQVTLDDILLASIKPERLHAATPPSLAEADEVTWSRPWVAVSPESYLED